MHYIVLKKVYTYWLKILLQVYTINLNPKYCLHLPNWMKQKRALLRSNSLGLIQSDSVIIRFVSLLNKADF
jgi:hypothetical protein